MLPPNSSPIPVPEPIAQVARAAFPKGNTFLSMRDTLGTVLCDQDFAQLFPGRGQPGLAPWRLALVTIMQFVEGLSDQQAADALKSRIDWKYALSLELTDPGFDFSVLCEFRARLIGGGQNYASLARNSQQLRGCHPHSTGRKAFGSPSTAGTPRKLVASSLAL